MAHAESDAEEPAGRRPLPPEDRVWRHPAEVAWEQQGVRRRRRRRRRQVGATAITGAAAAIGLIWLSQTSTTVTVRAETVDLAASALPSSTLRLLDAAGGTGPVDGIAIQSVSGAATLAGGVAVRDGFLVTSGRALDGADDVTVVWGDEVEHGTVVGYDPLTDVSVIAVEAVIAGGTALVVDSLRPDHGDAIELQGADGTTVDRIVVEPMAVTTAPDGDQLVGVMELDGDLGQVAPGSPAVDRAGSVIGIATATAGAAAVIPIDVARGVADEIIASGRAQHPWLGLTARDHLPDDPDPIGAVVTEVEDGGPAAVGGVAAGDVIVDVGGVAVDSTAAMISALRTHDPGDVIDILVDRGGVMVGCRVELVSHLGSA